MWGGAYVVRERSAVSSVVSMVMLAVLKLMVNVNCKGKCHPKRYIKRVSYQKERENIKGNQYYSVPSVASCGLLLTLVSLFIGFPKSHSTWEPLVFAWHLICKQSGVLGQTT